RMSGASSTVSSMVNSGAISTMPPMAETPMMASTKPMALRSSLRWKNSGIGSLSRLDGGGRPMRGRHVRGAVARRTAMRRADGHEDVPGTDHRAGEEEQPAHGAGDVVGMHGDQAVDEGIGERAAVGVGAPH